MSLLVDPSNLAFLDGYIFRVMANMLRKEGPEASGMYDYYKARVEKIGTALSDYDRMLFRYVYDNFDRDGRRILHAGTGLGTLPSALAMGGYQVAGIEQDAPRFRAAVRMRDALADVWPDEAGRYQLIAGEFPSIVASTMWMAQPTVLIFTNCGGNWPADLTSSAIAAFRQVGDVLLDARLFGKVRDQQKDRDDLIDQMRATGLSATPIAETTPGAYYYHLRRDD